MAHDWTRSPARCTLARGTHVVGVFPENVLNFVPVHDVSELDVLVRVRQIMEPEQKLHESPAVGFE